MTTDYSCLRFATEEHVAQILLDAPPVNCIGEGLLQDLEWLLDTLEHMPQLRAVVIGSTNPKIFCAGADVNQFLSWDAESGAKMSGWGNRIFDRIAALPVPVICAISGGAYGGGELVNKFVGFQNFEYVLTSGNFWSGVGRVLIYTLIQVPLMIIIALALAMVIDSFVVKHITGFRLGYFLPYAIPGVVASIIWVYLYNGQI